MKFTDDTLTNGLRVLVVQSRFAPVVSAELFVPVGSRADAPGRSGQAHLLEHLTGDTVPDYVRRAGMVFDASTASDLANYFFIAPVENVDAALFFLATNLRRLEFDSVRLVAVVVKRLGLRRDLYSVLQILSVTLSRKCPSCKSLPKRRRHQR